MPTTDPVSDTSPTARPTSPPQPTEIYGVFVDDINQPAASRIVQGITGAIAGGAKHLHVMFQSWGGFVGDAVMLYNLLRSLTIVDVSLYNSGQVQSAAVTAYLGATHRIASPRSIFMLHRTHVSPQGATAAKLEKMARNLLLDDDRSEAIWREHLKLPEDLWKQLDYHDLYLTGEEAVKYGIATELGEFSPPAGTAIYRV
jgi:ATP-dependent protease ClpP protease subunit